MTVFLQSDFEQLWGHNSDSTIMWVCCLHLPYPLPPALCKRKESCLLKKVEWVISSWAKLTSHSTVGIVSPLSAQGGVFLNNNVIPKKRSSFKTDSSISIVSSVWLVCWDGVIGDLMHMDCTLEGMLHRKWKDKIGYFTFNIQWGMHRVF